MEPTDALRSIETALRLVIRDVLGAEDWLKAAGAPDEARLRERQVEEAKRRDGAVVSDDLLDYTETYHLTGLIERNWEKFKPAFNDKGRTLAFFGIIEDVRNSVAHSRDLVPFERDLISGIAGQLRNQASLFRSGKHKSSRYYPLIELVRDNFGNVARSEATRPLGGYPGSGLGRRIDVGQTLTFTGNAFSARGKPVKWGLLTGRNYGGLGVGPPPRHVGEGDSVAFEYTVTEDDVGEVFLVTISITTDSRFHRYMDYAPQYDDYCTFQYSINPPDE